MRMTTQDLATRLATVSSECPHRIRAQVMEAMRAAVPSEAGMFFNCVTRDARLHYGDMLADGEESLAEELPKYAGSPVTEQPWEPGRIHPRATNRFARLRTVADDTRLLSEPVVHEVLEPLEVEAQLRALIFDGTTFLGWIGLMRRGKGARFWEDEQKTLNGAIAGLKTALAGARILEDEQFAEGVCAVLTATGRLEHASSTFESWATPSRRASLRQWIRAFDVDEDVEVRKAVGSAEVGLLRLDGADGVRYLATVGRAEPLRLDPACCLTTRQREVAEYAAVGATNAEIGSALGISAETVKTHMKGIYKRLEVASRLELSHRLGASI